MDAFIGLAVSIVFGVIVSLVTLWLTVRQRARQERQAEAARREVVLAGIGRELQWNRSATRTTLDAGNAHYVIGRLATVAFERHGSELARVEVSNSATKALNSLGLPLEPQLLYSSPIFRRASRGKERKGYARSP